MTKRGVLREEHIGGLGKPLGGIDSQRLQNLNVVGVIIKCEAPRFLGLLDCAANLVVVQIAFFHRHRRTALPALGGNRLGLHHLT